MTASFSSAPMAAGFLRAAAPSSAVASGLSAVPGAEGSGEESEAVSLLAWMTQLAQVGVGLAEPQTEIGSDHGAAEGDSEEVRNEADGAPGMMKALNRAPIVRLGAASTEHEIPTTADPTLGALKASATAEAGEDQVPYSPPVSTMRGAVAGEAPAAPQSGAADENEMNARGDRPSPADLRGIAPEPAAHRDEGMRAAPQPDAPAPATPAPATPAAATPASATAAPNRDASYRGAEPAAPAAPPESLGPEPIGKASPLRGEIAWSATLSVTETGADSPATQGPKPSGESQNAAPDAGADAESGAQQNSADKRPAAKPAAVHPARPAQDLKLLDRNEPLGVKAAAPPTGQNAAAVPAVAATTTNDAAGSAAPPRPVAPPSAPAVVDAQLDPVRETGGPVRQVQFQLRTEAAGAAQVILADRGGQVDVTVRAADPSVVQALRGQIGQLTAGLDGHGYQVRYWTPPATPAPSLSGEGASAEDSSSGYNQDGRLQGRDPQRQPEPDPRHRTGWEDLLEENL